MCCLLEEIVATCYGKLGSFQIFSSTDHINNIRKILKYYELFFFACRSVEEARNADFRDTDILLATYPKTGIYSVGSPGMHGLHNSIRFLKDLVDNCCGQLWV